MSEYATQEMRNSPLILPNVFTYVITKKCIYVFQVTTTIIDSFQNFGGTKSPEETAIDIFYVPQVKHGES